MTSRLGIAVLALLLVAAASRASASLVNIDWKTKGDKLLTFDSATGLSWLNVGLTVDQSYAAVEGQLGTGGTFAGFRHATVSEVDTLGADAGITERTGQFDTTNVTTITNLISLVGTTLNIPADADEESSGFASDTSGGQHRSPFFEASSGKAEASIFSAAPSPDPQQFVGHWLVSSNFVPEPGALAFTVLAPLALRRRRRLVV